jgi:hypothetical protein
MASGLIAVKQAPVSQKGTLKIAGKGADQFVGRFQGGGVQNPSENVIGVVVQLRLGAAERIGLGWWHLVAATLTDESRW